MDEGIHVIRATCDGHIDIDNRIDFQVLRDRSGVIDPGRPSVPFNEKKMKRGLAEV